MAVTMLAKGPRLLALDALRALAILLVIGHHAAYRFPGSKDDIVAAFLRSVGWIGVDVFFALSGFLIVRILIRDAAAHDLSGFVRRRFYRIVPIFVVALAVFVAAALLTGQERDLLPRMWMPALFLNGWMIPFFGVDSVPYIVAWSLSVEEFAYVVLGICAIWARPGLWRGVVAFLVVAIVLRWLVVLAGWFDSQYLYFFVPARLDAIAFGGLGALGVYDRFVRHRHCAWVAGLSTIGLMIGFQWSAGIGGWFLPTLGYALFGLSCAVWVACLAQPGKHHSGGGGCLHWLRRSAKCPTSSTSFIFSCWRESGWLQVGWVSNCISGPPWRSPSCFASSSPECPGICLSIR